MVARLVSKQPPWSIATSTMTAPGVMRASCSRRISLGALAPGTSTFALTNATLPFVLALADKGWQAACKADPHLAAGLTVHAGAITHEAVARDLGKPYRPAASCWA